MTTPKTLQTVHLIECGIGVFLNFVAIYLILNKTSKVVGKYSRLLLCFCLGNLILAVSDCLIVPITLVSERTYLLVTTSDFIENEAVVYYLLVLYCTTFSLAIVLLMCQFVYRYAAVCRNSVVANMQPTKAGILCLAAVVVLCSIWAASSHFAAGCWTAGKEVLVQANRVYSERFQMTDLQKPARQQDGQRPDQEFAEGAICGVGCTGYHPLILQLYPASMRAIIVNVWITNKYRAGLLLGCF
ncbi:unnamed protein product, partial [Mesorhabditis spiculigera]